MDKEESLFLGCKIFTKLSVVLRLFILKAKSVWTNKSSAKLLELLKDMLLEGNKLSNRNYEANKILYPMDLDYIKIHACRNIFILYKKEYKNLNMCSNCGESRTS